jgi:hypothetical protein
VAGIRVRTKPENNEDSDFSMVGEGKICPQASYYNKITRECVAINDDENDNEESTTEVTEVSDGQSVKIYTTAVEQNSHIFITAKGQNSLDVNLIVTEKVPGKYFVVKSNKPTQEQTIDFDWMIIKTNK